MRPSKFMYFSAYALPGLVLPFSSFFMLLKTYGLQLQDLSPHSITLVVIFMHLYEMCVAVRPSVRLFKPYHVLCSVGRDVEPIGGFYFQHGVKGPAPYIVTITPDNLDRCRQDWVLMQGEVHDWMVLPTVVPSNRSL
jgi:hypothetical protein